MDGSPRMIRNHKSWDREKVDRDQQCLEGSGIRLDHFCVISDQNVSCFWNLRLEIRAPKGISDENTYLVTTPQMSKNLIILCSKGTFSIYCQIHCWSA